MIFVKPLSKTLLIMALALGLNGCLIVPIYSPKQEANSTTQTISQNAKPNTDHLQKSYQYLQTQGPFITSANIHSIEGELGILTSPRELQGSFLDVEAGMRVFSRHTITKQDLLIIDYFFATEYTTRVGYEGVAIEYAHTFAPHSLLDVFDSVDKLIGGSLAFSLGGRYSASYVGYRYDYSGDNEGKNAHSLQLLANIGVQKNNKQAYLRLQGNHTGYLLQAKASAIFDNNLRIQTEYSITDKIPASVFTPSIGFVFHSSLIGDILLEASAPLPSQDFGIGYPPIFFHLARIQ